MTFYSAIFSHPILYCLLASGWRHKLSLWLALIALDGDSLTSITHSWTTSFYLLDVWWSRDSAYLGSLRIRGREEAFLTTLLASTCFTSLMAGACWGWTLHHAVAMIGLGRNWSAYYLQLAQFSVSMMNAWGWDSALCWTLPTVTHQGNQTTMWETLSHLANS